MPDPCIELVDLTVRFRSASMVTTIYSKVNATVDSGSLTAIVGPSGSGKSVLLNLLLGNLPEDSTVSGSVKVFGTEVSRAYPRAVLRRVGVVFQQDALFEDLSVRGNVAFGMRRNGFHRGEVSERVESLLKAVGLDASKTHIGELSGGQRKRLALARTLAAGPELILFDEPTAGLDPARARQIASLIAQTHANANPRRTTLVVTHDCEAVLPIAERIFYVDAALRGLRVVEREEATTLLLDPKRVAPPVPERKRKGALDRALDVVRWLGRAVEPLFQFLLEPLPSSLRQFALRLREALFGPAAFIAVASLLVGALATFFALENNPLRGAMDRPVLVGLGKVLVAVVAPLCAGCLFAARTGAGETARLGHLRYSKQVDALRTFGREQAPYLVSPLVWACVLALPVLTLAAAALASTASLAVATAIRPLTAHGWAAAFSSELGAADLPWLMANSLGSGLIVAMTAVRHGLAPKSSAEDISDAVTAAIVSGSIGVILLQSVLALAQFGEP